MAKSLFFACLVTFFTFLASQQPFIQSNRYLVLHLSRLGLANRLAALADWHVIAKQSKRHLLLSWERALDCNIAFQDLFKEGPSDFTVLESSLPPGDEGRDSVREMARESQLTFTSIYPSTDFFYLDEERHVLFTNQYDIIYTTFDGAVVLPRTPCQAHLLSRSKFYQSLVPTDEVQQLIEGILPHYENKVMIGVHIRMHNKDFDWAVIPPIAGKPMTSFTSS